MLPLVIAAAAIGAALLATSKGGLSSSSSAASDAAGGASQSPADKKAADKARLDAQNLKDANEATKVFAGLVTLVGAAISASSPPAAPFVGGASAAVAIAWSSLSTQDKARVWRGELK